MARATLQIDESLLAEAMAAAGSKTRGEAIETALRELIRSRQRERLRQELGTFDLALTVEELRRQRRAR